MKPSVLFLFITLYLFTSCSNNHDSSHVVGTGVIEPYTEVNVGSKVSNQVTSMSVQEGSYVNKGDVIATIDPVLYNLEYKEALAEVELAKAKRDLLKIGAREEDIQKARDALKEAESRYKVSKLNKDRFSSLVDKGSATKSQFDDVMSEYEVDEAQLNAAKQELQKMLHFTRPEELREAEAQLGKAQAQADYLQQRVHDCNIQAPISGMISYKPINTGELVNHGTTLVTISDLSKVKVTVYISDLEIGKVKVNQEADVFIDSFPKQVFKGKVVFIGTHAEFTPKNIQTVSQRVKLVFPVKVEVDNPHQLLKGGLPATAEIKV